MLLISPLMPVSQRAGNEGYCYWLLNVDKGELFGWGNTEYSQLAGSSHNDEMQVNVPRHIPVNNVGKVVKAAAAGSTCAVINGN